MIVKLQKGTHKGGQRSLLNQLHLIICKAYLDAFAHVESSTFQHTKVVSLTPRIASLGVELNPQSLLVLPYTSPISRLDLLGSSLRPMSVHHKACQVGHHIDHPHFLGFNNHLIPQTEEDIIGSNLSFVLGHETCKYQTTFKLAKKYLSYTKFKPYQANGNQLRR